MHRASFQQSYYYFLSNLRFGQQVLMYAEKAEQFQHQVDHMETDHSASEPACSTIQTASEVSTVHQLIICAERY